MTPHRRYEITDGEREQSKMFLPKRQDGQLRSPRNDDHQILNERQIIQDVADDVSNLDEQFDKTQY